MEEHILMDKYMPSMNEKRIGEFFKLFSKNNQTDYIKFPSFVCSNKVKCDYENQNFFRF